MKKFKFLLIIGTLFLFCGCGKTNNTTVIDKFTKKVNSVKSYEVTGVMEIVSNDETYSYDVDVDYKYDDNYKVTLINKTNDHEQVILKTNSEVYVVTPALNKSFKFQSEWPENSSQSYLLKSLVDDIKKTENPVVDVNDDYYIVNALVNYPNNSSLVTEKIYFDKNFNLKEVQVLNKEGNASIRMKFNKIEYSAKFEDNNFNLDTLVKEECTENCDSADKTNETSAIDDVIYPLYLPENTHLSTKDVVDTDSGDRVIITYAGSKPFMLIEENATVGKEMEVTSVYGDPLLLSMGVGALAENSLEWQTNNRNYYITSSYLTSEELMTIAESLNTASVVEITNK